MTRPATSTSRPLRFMRFIAAWLLVLGYGASETGVVESLAGVLETMEGEDHASGCCDDEGDFDCPPACGDGLCCAGIAHVPAPRVEFLPNLPVPHLATVLMPADPPPADGSSLRVFRPPRSLA